MIHQVVPHLRLLTLGAPLLVSTTKDAVRYRTRKHFALLIRLALEPGKRFARDYLIDLLWPDVPGERGRHSLSQAITVLRHTVGRQHLAVPQTSVVLAEGAIEVDALRLETGEPEIRGRFLEGFEVRGARGFDEWRESLVAQLDPRIRDCLVNRMDAARRIGDFATVERHARVLEAIDPHAEDAVRGIMEARAWVGDRSNALKVYARFVARIAEDLKAKPGPELNRIADLLREGRRPAERPAADGASRPRQERRFEAETIIGRQAEFSTLYDAWVDARQNRSRVIVVLGEPGIGKTTLANAFVSSCQMEAGIVARTQAYDAERELPYAVLAELVRQLTLQRAIGTAEPEALSELSRLTPEIRNMFTGVLQPTEWRPEVVPLRLADAFYKAVAAVSDEFPLVLIVDDIHAADNASVAILHMMARKLRGLRVLMILTGRPGSLRPPSSAQALVTDAVIEGLGRIELDALSSECAALLVARASMKGLERWGQPPVESIVRAGGGNPLALELLAHEWVSSGGDSLASKLDALHSLPAGLQSIPRAIRAMVERQTQELADRTRAVFDLASMLGRRMADLWLYQVIGCSEADALSHLTRLLEAGLLREVAGVLEFRNELIRVHAYYEIPKAVRVELHRRIAGELAQRTKGNVRNHLEVAWHYLLGSDLDHALPLALSGAEQSLQAGAPREAEQILRRLMREEIAVETVRRIQLLLSSALMSQSRAEEALPFLETLLATDGLERKQVASAARLYASAMYLLNKNSMAKHSEMAERALAHARECDDEDLLAHALFECARSAIDSGNAELARKTRHELRSTFIDRPGWIPPIAHHANAYCSYYLLDIAEASESAAEAVRQLSHTDNHSELAQAYTGLGNCMVALARASDARQYYQLALVQSRMIGDDCRTSIVTSNLAASYLLEGDLQLAISNGEESLSIGKRAPAQPGLLRTWTNLGFAHLLAGDVEKAIECFRNWQQWIRDGRSWAAQMEYWCDTAAMELALGNTTEALRVIDCAERAYQGREDICVNQGNLERLRVYLAYHTSGADAARQIAAESLSKFEGRSIVAEMEVVAALGWLEKQTVGVYSEAIRQKLNDFERYRLFGKWGVLAAQGFLEHRVTRQEGVD